MNQGELLVAEIILILLSMTFSDQLIDELITCPKKVIEAPKDSGVVRGSRKIKFMLESVNGQYSFSGFISKNLTFQENYSIGLVYNPKEEKNKIVLVRVNGPHGPNENAPHHDGPHIHLATADRINAGLKPEGEIEIDVPYSTIEDAIQYYIKRINIIPADRIKHFPPPNNQIDINFEQG